MPSALRFAIIRSGRPPRGGRGLKLSDRANIWKTATSPSSRRAWIEIFSSDAPCCSIRVALLAEGVD